MRQGRSTGAANAGERARFDGIRAKGCLACRLEGMGATPCEVHHLNEGEHHGGRRRGHRDTIGLCEWHHRGVCREGWAPDEMANAYGPSWAHQPNAFRARYGGDERLLKLQDELLML